MTHMLGFLVIVVLYLVVGLMAATGTIFVARRFLAARQEQVFFAMFLVMVAGFYLGFAAYFEIASAWRLEAAVVMAYVVVGVLGVRFPFLLILGYSLHGVWDLVHELQAHGAWSAFAPGRLTAIPLAYGVFCATFDLSVAAYVFARRAEWRAAWKGDASSQALTQSAGGE